jgi:hypothetical protein
LGLDNLADGTFESTTNLANLLSVLSNETSNLLDGVLSINDLTSNSFESTTD